MNGPASGTDVRRDPVMRRAGLKLCTLFGIEIRLDFSVAIIFFLVTWSLGSGLFPDWHPDWSVARSWLTALAAGVLLFVSLLAHELAHSVMAKRHGISVPRITLFLFGGVSEMEQEPETPASEMLIAIVGPLTSLALGAIFLWLGMTLAGNEAVEQLLATPQIGAAALGPLATLLFWLGPVNLFLALFNLIPGFPLDGGRVFRSAIWWFTGDQARATRIAAHTGMGVAWALMALGLFQLLQGVIAQGLWLMLIGWFLQGAARSSQTQAVLQRALARLSVRDLMRTRFEVAAPDTGLETFVEEYLLRSGQSAWPVVQDRRLIGILSYDDVRARFDSGQRGGTIRDAMRPIDHRIDPDMAGRDALRTLLGSDLDPLPVTEHGRIIGLLYRADIMRWLAVHHLEAA